MQNYAVMQKELNLGRTQREISKSNGLKRAKKHAKWSYLALLLIDICLMKST